jgi:hypothetical protein
VFNASSNTMPRFTSHAATRALVTVAAVVAVVAPGLTACSRREAVAVRHPAALTPPAAVVARVDAEPAIETAAVDKTRSAELMRAIFDDSYQADDGTALVAIEDGDDAGYWRMTLYAAKDLPDGRTAVVVNGAPSDESGADGTAHASSGMLSVYTLRRKEGAWKVIERHQDLGTMGSNGNVGVIKWIELGAGKPGIVVSSGGTWFGSTFADAAVYDLDRNMRRLGAFAELSSNAGACTPELKDCWDVEGKIGTVPSARADNYRDIVVDFSGKHFRVTENAKGDYVEHATRTVHQSARYHFDGKTYVLVAGGNPVPGIEG